MDTLIYVPLDRMFLETDSETSHTISERYHIFAKLRELSLEDIKSALFSNFSKFFKKKWQYHIGSERTELLVGEECLDKLSSSNVLLVGLGGVGSYVGEFLVRAGIGSLTIIDGDVVDVTNKNRQLPALKIHNWQEQNRSFGTTIHGHQ